MASLLLGLWGWRSGVLCHRQSCVCPCANAAVLQRCSLWRSMMTDQYLAHEVYLSKPSWHNTASMRDGLCCEIRRSSRVKRSQLWHAQFREWSPQMSMAVQTPTVYSVCVRTRARSAASGASHEPVCMYGLDCVVRVCCLPSAMAC